MIPRYIIRPAGIGMTPSLLAQDLGCRTRRWPNKIQFRPNWNRDFFMFYPERSAVDVDTGQEEEYNALRSFMAAAKPYQRRRLAEMGLPVPETYLAPTDVPAGTTGRFVIRPYHHSGGRNYRVTDNPLDFRVGEEYSSRVFPKTREYRLMYIKGRLACYWKKRPVDNTNPEDAWGHANNAVFVQVHHPDRSYLRHTDAEARIGATALARTAHIVAFDILYREHQYVVLEANLAPGLVTNHAQMAEIIRAS